MAIRAVIDFNRSDYSAFTGGAIAIPITEKQAAYIQSLLGLMVIRQAWEDMSDSDWDALEGEIAELIGLFE